MAKRVSLLLSQGRRGFHSFYLRGEEGLTPFISGEKRVSLLLSQGGRGSHSFYLRGEEGLTPFISGEKRVSLLLSQGRRGSRLRRTGKGMVLPAVT